MAHRVAWLSLGSLLGGGLLVVVVVVGSSAWP